MKTREKLVQDLVISYRNRTKKIRSCFHPLLKDYIPYNEYAVLKVLNCFGDQMVSEIADHLHVTNSHISVTSDKLINRGLVKRTHSSEDRRIVYLSITSEGKQMAEKMEEVLQGFYEKAFEELTEEEMETFISLLNKIKL
ncbi:MarR family transcriptional regulator [Fictibacillus enclensis]|uniref:MarR family winged helix-turn-helix transcriptional regulator n=1 Tax=Fictibacillus enclensis TaxID=1017270 RepID=UPI0025A30AAD|nr:MarR family transcriptional regulator [Fictibacillus enclensis]MDM5197377.1 MarR family transcriptional regulator [Fictibacillus enclensis]